MLTTIKIHFIMIGGFHIIIRLSFVLFGISLLHIIGKLLYLEHRYVEYHACLKVFINTYTPLQPINTCPAAIVVTEK